jgi:hypothetical protein
MRLQGIFYARFYLKPLPTNQKVAGSNPAGATIAIDAFLSGMRFFIAFWHRHACPIPATFPLPFLLFFNIFNIKA